jgi:NAD(P)-dependent dehydrogenase (short-subunit alcohol dehydrogenase family)
MCPFWRFFDLFVSHVPGARPLGYTEPKGGRNMRLQHKVAVITGGASGMGKATVERFLQEGARVVIADFNEAAGQAALEAFSALGYDEACSFIRTDVASEEDVIAMLDHAVGCFGGVDVLFNNAGVGGAIGPLTETRVEDWDYTFDVLAKGVFLGIKHGARIMRAAGRGGSIINTASIAGLSGDGGPLVYSAAKAAVISLSQSAAVELAPDRIRVNAICPGFIVTPLADGGDPEGTQRAFSKGQPWPDYGRGEDIAGAALFLASEDAAFVTGEKLVVDGGLTAAGPELSKKFPRTSARNSKVSGVTRGSTGAAPDLRTLT